MNKLVSNPKFANYSVAPFCWYTILTSGFFALIILVVMILLNLKFRKNYVKTRAKIVNEFCGEQFYNKDYERMRRNCELDIEFTHLNGSLIKSAMYAPDGYKQFSKFIDIEYDPLNPEGTATTKFPMIFVNGLLAFFLVLFLGNTIFFYIFRNSGWLCVASGARMVFGKK